MKILTYLVVVLSIITSNVYSQSDREIEKKLILLFLNEDIITLKETDNNNKVYNAELIFLEVDSIGNFDEYVYFFKFELGKNRVKLLEENINSIFNSSSCNQYIFGLNVFNNNFYRLKGFAGNDLLYLLRDIQKSPSRQKEIIKILNDLSILIDKIDFEEVYDAIINLDFDSKSLLNCSEGKKAHGRID